jgi:hypothetical protein
VGRRLAPGCMGVSFGYSAAGDRQEMITLIRTAVERVSGSSTPLRFTALL